VGARQALYGCPCYSYPPIQSAVHCYEVRDLWSGFVVRREWNFARSGEHRGAKEQDEYLTPDPWGSHWTSTTWQEYLSAGETEARLAVIRQRTHTGRPLGTEDFIQDLEKATQRRIALHKRGPREKSSQIEGKVNSPSTRKSLSIP
jgi:hypothetical protein